MPPELDARLIGAVSKGFGCNQKLFWLLRHQG
jgi:hypothetical protein